jgi:hypothetical protein
LPPQRALLDLIHAVSGEMQSKRVSAAEVERARAEAEYLAFSLV